MAIQNESITIGGIKYEIDATLMDASPVFGLNLLGNRVSGVIYNDKKGRFPDRESMIISSVQRFTYDSKTHSSIVFTQNSIYHVYWWERFGF